MLSEICIDKVSASAPDPVSESSIEGLRFEENHCESIADGQGWFHLKTGSSPGPLVSDFVTHEADFSYSTYGIHVGQDDRLTFFGPEDQLITGYFVDCRIGSRTSGQACQFAFYPSPRRRLVIPRGVAHTFDGLAHILTRDEPVWHSDVGNEAWNIDNDLISVSRDTEFSKFPRVQPNRHRLPDAAHHFMSCLSQELLENPKSYLARYQVNIGGVDQYVMLEPKNWEVNPVELQSALKIKTPKGLSLRRARYAATGPKSWTLVPSTASCIADVLSFKGTEGEFAGPLRYHLRTRKFYTFLTEGAVVEIQSLDLRHAPQWSDLVTTALITEPRIVLAVEPGVGYRIRASKDIVVRCEHEVFVAADEPREDLPTFGTDLRHLDHGELIPAVRVAEIECPPSITRLLARAEQANQQ